MLQFCSNSDEFSERSRKFQRSTGVVFRLTEISENELLLIYRYYKKCNQMTKNK